MINTIIQWWKEKPLWLKIVSFIFVVILIIVCFVFLFPKKMAEKLLWNNSLENELDEKYNYEYEQNKTESKKLNEKLKENEDELLKFDEEIENIFENNRGKHEKINNTNTSIDDVISLLAEQRNRHKKTN
jgi:hypothetical protein